MSAVGNDTGLAILKLIAEKEDAQERAAILLVALRAAVEDLVSLANSRWSELECSADELVADYRAAIAKAEGRS